MHRKPAFLIRTLPLRARCLIQPTTYDMLYVMSINERAADLAGPQGREPCSNEMAEVLG
jgi:hypothetical protein